MIEDIEIYIRKESSKYVQFDKPKNDLILKILVNKNLKGLKVSNETIPFWIMRQAGRYLSEYKEIRKKYDFIEICKNPELSSEVTILPYKILKTDMLVIFSDILIIFNAMGLNVNFIENKGMEFEKNILNIDDFKKLNLNLSDIINNLHYVYDSINITKQKINNEIPILGFCGSPFTLFMYMTKNNKRTYEDSLKMIYDNPLDVHFILKKLSDICTSHLINQIDSGANIIQIFDSNAEQVDKNMFKEFSLDYLHKIINCIKKIRPNAYIILYIKDNFHENIKDLDIDVLSITHKQLIDKGSKFFFDIFNDNIILQGGLDPHILLIENENIVKEYTKKLLENIIYKNKYIANLGHGILPNSKINNVHAFINTIKGK